LIKSWFGGQSTDTDTEHVTVGAWQSLTVTVNMQVEALPAASVAVQVTVVVPTGKNVPDGGEQTTVTPGQLSVAVAVKVTMAPHWSGSLHCVTGAGQLIVGGSQSFTVTEKVHVRCGTSKHGSVRVHVTTVLPTGKNMPDGGTQTVLVTSIV
jgi:hypothetical protein